MPGSFSCTFTSESSTQVGRNDRFFMKGCVIKRGCAPGLSSALYSENIKGGEKSEKRYCTLNTSLFKHVVISHLDKNVMPVYCRVSVRHGFYYTEIDCAYRGPRYVYGEELCLVRSQHEVIVTQ